MKNNPSWNLAYEILIFLGVVILILFISKLWVLLFLAVIALLVCALRMLFLKFKSPAAAPEPVQAPEAVRPDTEMDIQLRAFGLLQRRITEAVLAKHPTGRWVWAEGRAFERFIHGLPLNILLNGAGGFRAVLVRTHNLLFLTLEYEPAPLVLDAPPSPTEDMPPMEADAPMEAEPVESAPANYELAAFEWMGQNLERLNIHCEMALNDGQEQFLILQTLLPHPDIWPDICGELLRNGFSQAEALEGGIQVTLPHRSAERK